MSEQVLQQIEAAIREAVMQGSHKAADRAIARVREILAARGVQ